MKLSVLERIVLLSILPKEGNILTVRVVRELRKDVEFTEDELKKFSLQVENQKTVWDRNADAEVEIEISESQCGIIKGALKQLDDLKKLTQDHVSLYDKFII